MSEATFLWCVIAFCGCIAAWCVWMFVRECWRERKWRIRNRKSAERRASKLAAMTPGERKAFLRKECRETDRLLMSMGMWPRSPEIIVRVIRD